MFFPTKLLLWLTLCRLAPPGYYHEQLLSGANDTAHRHRGRILAEVAMFASEDQVVEALQFFQSFAAGDRAAPLDEETFKVTVNRFLVWELGDDVPEKVK